MSGARPKRPYQIIKQATGKVLDEGHTPKTDAEIIREPIPPQVLANISSSGFGPYLYQVKDHPQDTWRTVHKYC